MGIWMYKKIIEECSDIKKECFCDWKSIEGTVRLDVHNLAMTFRESQPVDFFFIPQLL